MIDRKPIPNINIGQVYDQRYSDAEVHYDKLGNLAEFFGRNMPVHRHDRFFQVFSRQEYRSGLSFPSPTFWLCKC